LKVKRVYIDINHDDNKKAIEEIRQWLFECGDHETWVHYKLKSDRPNQGYNRRCSLSRTYNNKWQREYYYRNRERILAKKRKDRHGG